MSEKKRNEGKTYSHVPVLGIGTKERVNKPISITLSIESKAALQELKNVLKIDNVSKFINDLLEEKMENLGYQKVEKEMQTFYSGQIEVSVIGKSVLPVYQYEDQKFIKADFGEYSIKIKNNSGYRRLVVVSVDGRNVMNGESASYNDSGYILEPYGSVNIKGWRRTNDEVAAFEFVDIESSYDKLMGGDGSNIGVIGVAVFEEKQNKTMQPIWIQKPKSYPLKDKDTGIIPSPWIPEPWITWNLSRGGGGISNSSSVITSNSIISSSIGTGYGDATSMKVVNASFERNSSQPNEIITLRYASEVVLRKWGVIKDSVIPKISPFPKETKSFTPEPPGWTKKVE